MHPSSSVDVQSAFTNFVRSFDGEIVEDLVGPSPTFLNADYLFRKAGIVAELKRLVSNQAEDALLKERIQAKFDKWIADGTIGPIYGRTVVQSKTLPLHCQRELVELYRSPLQHRIVKANKQIKQTLAELRVQNGKGLLIIVNDGNYALEADAALYMINRVLGKNFKQINSIVYCTVNMFAITPYTEKPSLIWVHASRKSVAEPVDSEWVMQLFRSWRTYLQGLTGAPIEEVLLSGPADVERVRYDSRI